MMDLVEEFYTSNFATFLKSRYSIGFEDAEKELEKFASDYDLIEHYLNKKYPDNVYFVLIDYTEDDSFHIRIWEI